MDKMAERKREVETSLSVHYGAFGRYYKEWNVEGIRDDRRVFCNLYEIIEDALKTSTTITNNTILVALNERLRRDQRQMSEIVKHFTGSFPVFGLSEYYPEDL